MRFRKSLSRVGDGARRQDRLQLGHLGQLSRVHTQVLDATGGQNALSDLQAAPRSGAITIQVDGQHHDPLGIAHRKRHVARAQQAVPVPHLQSIVGLAKAHQSEFWQDQVRRKGTSKAVIQAALTSSQHRPSRNGPFFRQGGRRVLGPPPPVGQRATDHQSHEGREDQIVEAEGWVHGEDVNQPTAFRCNFGRAGSGTVAGFPESSFSRKAFGRAPACARKAREAAKSRSSSESTSIPVAFHRSIF